MEYENIYWNNLEGYIISKISIWMEFSLRYNDERPIKITKLPVFSDFKDFKEFVHDSKDENKKISENRIILKINEKKKNKVIERIKTGGTRDFVNRNLSGIVINIHLKEPDPVLSDKLLELTKKLTKKHLKLGILKQEHYTISCDIDSYEPNQEKINKFTLEFMKELQNKILTKEIIKTAKSIENQYVITCKRCGLKISGNEIKEFDVNYELPGKFCKDCFEIINDKLNTIICNRCKDTFSKGEMTRVKNENGFIGLYCSKCYDILCPSFNINLPKEKDKESKKLIKKTKRTYRTNPINKNNYGKGRDANKIIHNLNFESPEIYYNCKKCGKRIRPTESKIMYSNGENEPYCKSCFNLIEKDIGIKANPQNQKEHNRKLNMKKLTVISLIFAILCLITILSYLILFEII